MSFKIPPFLIKKIFPPKKAVSTVDTTGDGKADSIQIKALNVMAPFTVPENIDLGDFDINDFDLSEYAEILLDGDPMDISKENINFNVIRDRFKIYHKGDGYTLDELFGGKAAGKIIAMGDTLTILLKLDEKEMNKFITEGSHTLTIEAENIPTLEISFELSKKNMNIKFDPNNT